MVRSDKRQPLGRLTISGGVSAFPVDGTQSTDMIRGADEALYRAKASQRNCVLAHEPSTLGDAAAVPQHR